MKESQQTNITKPTIVQPENPAIAPRVEQPPVNHLYEYRLQQLEESLDKLQQDNTNQQQAVLGFAKDAQETSTYYVQTHIGFLSLVIVIFSILGWLAGKKFIGILVDKLFEERMKERLKEKLKEYDDDIAEIRNEAELTIQLLPLKPEQRITKLQYFLNQVKEKYDKTNNDAKRQHLRNKLAKYQVHLGNQYDEIKNYNKAIENYNEAIKLNPNYADAYFNLGYVYNAQQNYNKAIENYNKAIKLNPNDPEAYYNRGWVYDAQQNYDEAIKDYDKAIELNRNYADAYYNRGVAYYEQQNYDKAIKDYDKAIELNPSDSESYYNRGCAYFAQQNYDKAIENYDKAIELNPDYADAHYYNACAYAKKPDGEVAENQAEAIKCLSKAVDLDEKYKEMAKNDDDFSKLRHLSDFAKLVN